MQEWCLLEFFVEVRYITFGISSPPSTLQSAISHVMDFIHFMTADFMWFLTAYTYVA